MVHVRRDTYTRGIILIMSEQNEIEGVIVQAMKGMFDVQGLIASLPKEEACQHRDMIADIRNRADSTLFTIDEYIHAKERAGEIRKFREAGGL